LNLEHEPRQLRHDQIDNFAKRSGVVLASLVRIEPNRRSGFHDHEPSDAAAAAAALGRHPLRSPHGERHNRRARCQRDARDAGLSLHGQQIGIGRDRRLGIDNHGLAFGERVERAFDGSGFARAALDGNLARALQHEAEEGVLPQFGLREEADAAAGVDGDELSLAQRVEVGDVIAGENHRTGLRNVLKAEDAPAEE
jgi:hypothetical protein